jgi:hypothetical protein
MFIDTAKNAGVPVTALGVVSVEGGLLPDQMRILGPNHPNTLTTGEETGLAQPPTIGPDARPVHHRRQRGQRADGRPNRNRSSDEILRGFHADTVGEGGARRGPVNRRLQGQSQPC